MAKPAKAQANGSARTATRRPSMRHLIVVDKKIRIKLDDVGTAKRPRRYYRIQKVDNALATSKPTRGKLEEYVKINLAAFKNLDKEFVRENDRKFALLRKGRLLSLHDCVYVALDKGYDQYPDLDFIIGEIGGAPHRLGPPRRRYFAACLQN